MKTIGRVLAVLATMGCLLGCGESDIGEECDESGTTDECVADGVCTGEGGETAYCRLICTVQEDCPEGFNCNGVPGASASELKSCQP